jgi:O-methyltransferase
MTNLRRLLQCPPIRRLLLAIEGTTVMRYAAWRGWQPSPRRYVTLEDLRWYHEGEHDAEIKAAASKVVGYTLVSWGRLASLWHQVSYLDRAGIPGALVECGVYHGGSSAMMALAHIANVNPPSRPLHLFDSFEGVPEPAAIDGALAHRDFSRVGASVKALSAPISVSRELLTQQCGYSESLLHYHVGWFEQTLPADASSVGAIALLRFDGDLYGSAKICLEQLYEQVSPGGIVVIDDYFKYDGCRKAVDEFMRRLPPTLLNPVDSNTAYWVKPLTSKGVTPPVNPSSSAIISTR